MAANYTRIHRLLKIITLIQGERGWTSRRLAEECGVSERTIFRDLKMLDAAGIPYFFDPDNKCYSIHRDFFLPPMQLTLDEALALTALAEHVGASEQVPFTQAAARAISKIRGHLPVALRQELEEIERHMTIRLAASQPSDGPNDVYERVRKALMTKRVLRCEYESLAKDQIGREFLLKPYTLFFCQRAWYVIGHHSLYDEVRCMKLTRFTTMQHTDIPYEIPKDFSLAEHLGCAWRMIRGEKRYEVELAFDAEFAETISDTQWHSTQQILWHEDQSITFRCTVDGLDEIVWWVLSMGPHCVVKKPRELAMRVKQLAEGIVQQYAQPAKSAPSLTHSRQ